MYQNTIVFMVIAVVSAFAAPEPKPIGVVAPVAAPLVAQAVAPGFVTAQSSQVIARNYNSFATPLVAAAPAPIAVAPYFAAAPYVAPASYVAAPYVTRYATAPVPAAAPSVATTYAAAPVVARSAIAPSPTAVVV